MLASLSDFGLYKLLLHSLKGDCWWTSVIYLTLPYLAIESLYFKFTYFLTLRLPTNSSLVMYFIIWTLRWTICIFMVSSLIWKTLTVALSCYIYHLGEEFSAGNFAIRYQIQLLGLSGTSVRIIRWNCTEIKTRLISIVSKPIKIVVLVIVIVVVIFVQ